MSFVSLSQWSRPISNTTSQILETTLTHQSILGTMSLISCHSVLGSCHSVHGSWHSVLGSFFLFHKLWLGYAISHNPSSFASVLKWGSYKLQPFSGWSAVTSACSVICIWRLLFLNWHTWIMISSGKPLLIFVMFLVWLHFYIHQYNGVLVCVNPLPFFFHCCSHKDVPSGCLKLYGGSALDSPCCHWCWGWCPICIHLPATLTLMSGIHQI